MNDGSALVEILCAVGIAFTAGRCVLSERRRRWSDSVGRPLHVRIDR